MKTSFRTNALCSGMVAIVAASILPVYGQKLFFENFDTLPLGPNPEEASKGAKVWTRTPPAGWRVDDSQMPGFGTPDYAANDGRTEWAGWAFADVKWWPTVDNQRRSEFTLASGAAAIADPDEWDDATHLQGFFNSYLSTPPISVAGKAANSLILTFDSSWRPEAQDDGLPGFPVDQDGNETNNQTAVITAQWDSGEPVEIIRWDSISDSPFYKGDNEFINEAALAELKNPAGAQKLVLKIGLINAANDWWWAFDNLAVGEPPLLTGITATGIGFSVRITEALNKTIDEAAPITAKLDGQTITVTHNREAHQVFVVHDQSPKIFTPGSRHSVEVTFTTATGNQVMDSAEFIAPSYTTISATPALVSGSISETSYLSVDEGKGITLELDGSAVIPQSVQRVDLIASDGTDLPDRIDMSYSVSSPFAPASKHTLKVTFTTKTGQEVVETLEFLAPSYPTLPSALATALGTGSQAGMRWRTHQLATGRPANDIANSEKQLRGELGASVHDPTGQTATGEFDISFVNFDQVGSDAGNFKTSAEPLAEQVQDEFFPGIPDGHAGGTDNIAGEALAFVEIPQPGVYTMVVNSDDGFQVSVGNTNNPAFLVLERFDGTRGQADTRFYFKADATGVYLFRLLWFEGGGDARVEWFTANPDGSRALINGTQPGALKAFRTRIVPEPALPSSAPQISIERSATGIRITFTGTLQKADTINGSYTDMTGTTSPAEMPITGSAAYFRTRN